MLRSERLKGLHKRVPYRPSFLERQILLFEKAERPSLLKVNYRGFHPTVASISSGSRLAPGVRFWQPDIGRSGLSVHASGAYSLEGYELYELQLGRIPHKGRDLPPRSTRGDDVYELGRLPKADLSGLILYPSLRYRHNPSERFFGLGPDSRLEDRTSFRLQDATYELVAGWQLSPRAAATVRLGYLQASVGPGEAKAIPAAAQVFSEATAPGLTRQPDFLKAAAQVFLDYRDEPFNPHRGGMLALAYARFDDRGRGERFRFHRWALDARGYVPLGSAQRVFALRLYTSLDDPAAGSRVPFYLQEALGSSHLLRGFETFRFRGEKLLSLQAEYRWEAAPALELALFVDAGQVSSRTSELDVSDLERSYGFGIRGKAPKETLVRFDVARGREGTRVFFRFSPSF